MAEQVKKPGKLNRMKSTALAGKMVNEHWNKVFNAPSSGKPLLFYDGYILSPFFQTADTIWAHGEAFSALLAARHEELPPQRESERRGYNRELCSYARTHMGCALCTARGYPEDFPPESIAKDLPKPDILVSVYPQCNTGLLWDDFNHRLFGVDKVPKFNINLPLLTGAGVAPGDKSYMNGPQFKEAVEYVKMQLIEFSKFLAAETGKPFDWDKFGELMMYAKKAGEFRNEGMEMAMKATPCPASFFDWAAAIAPVNFGEIGPERVAIFQAMKDEVEERIKNGVGAVQNERYRLYWDGIMNWNKLGALAKKFAEFDACMVSGRYAQEGFWQHPELIDLNNPLDGFVANLLSCPSNHGIRPATEMTERLVKDGKLDGIVFHTARTCRSMTNQILLLQETASRKWGIATTSFEGDTTDESFYQDEILNKHLEALFEAIDARRALNR